MIAVAEQDRPLLIIAESIEKDAMALILRNKIEGDMNVVGVNPPMYGEGRIWRLEDLAVQTGGRFISKELYKICQPCRINRIQKENP